MMHTKATITGPLFDICARKHRGSVTSVEANKRVDKTAGRMMVMDYLHAHGNGTLAEICTHYGKEKNTLSGRCSELLAMEMIKDTGERRDGCRVYRLNEQ